VRATAKKYGVSRLGLDPGHALPGRRSVGLRAALETTEVQSLATPTEVEDRIIELRKELAEIGTDNGATRSTPTSSARCYGAVISTIQRILTRRGFVTRRRRNDEVSYIRFAAELPTSVGSPT